MTDWKLEILSHIILKKTLISEINKPQYQGTLQQGTGNWISNPLHFS